MWRFAFSGDLKDAAADLAAHRAKVADPSHPAFEPFVDGIVGAIKAGLRAGDPFTDAAGTACSGKHLNMDLRWDEKYGGPSVSLNFDVADQR